MSIVRGNRATSSCGCTVVAVKGKRESVDVSKAVTFIGLEACP